MVNRLFVLNIEFILAPAVNNAVVTISRALIDPITMPETSMYTKVKESLDLWHQHFGHPGEVAMKALIHSAFGIKIDPTSSSSSTCEPCIIAKHPANPHPSMTSPLSPMELFELIYCDICSPFPMETPHGKSYFIIFLDDTSSVNNLQLLATCDQALEAFCIVKVKWELKTGKKILRFCCDGAGEFRGEFAKFLQDEGIDLDVTPPYEHWMNRKAECFMHTIQLRIHAMMTALQLPMTYWGEAALTALYLLNLTTMSTLPNGMMPFQIFHGRQPNVAHLCVWGSRCFVHVPQFLPILLILTLHYLLPLHLLLIP